MRDSGAVEFITPALGLVVDACQCLFLVLFVSFIGIGVNLALPRPVRIQPAELSLSDVAARLDAHTKMIDGLTQGLATYKDTLRCGSLELSDLNALEYRLNAQWHSELATTKATCSNVTQDDLDSLRRACMGAHDMDRIMDYITQLNTAVRAHAKQLQVIEAKIPSTASPRADSKKPKDFMKEWSAFEKKIKEYMDHDT